MEELVYDLCFCFSDDCCQFFYRGVFYPFYCFEFFHQDVLCFWSYSFDVVYFRLEGVFAPLLTMERDGEAVYLVLDFGEDVE